MDDTAPALTTVLQAALEDHRAEVVRLTQDLIRAPSPNPPGDERAPAAILRAYLEGCADVDLHVLGPSPQRPTLVFGCGSGEPALALAAHMDTHGVHGSWASDPFAPDEIGGRITGLGSTDNKGAVAAMAVVFRAAAESGLARGRLLFIANADEETGGRFGIEAVRETLPDRPDAVVVAEPSGIETSYERLYVAARGTSRFRIAVRGIETHSSLADHPGVINAVERLERLLAALRDNLPLLSEKHPRYELGPTLIPVRIEGGKGWGVVPAAASAELELRLPPGYDQAGIEQTLQDAVAAAAEAAGVGAELEFAEGSLRWMGPSEVAPDGPLVEAASLAWEDVFGHRPTLGCFPGGTDARLFSEVGIPTLAGVGPGALVRAHHPDEYVTIDELDLAVRLYAAIVSRYLEPGGLR